MGLDPHPRRGKLSSRLSATEAPMNVFDGLKKEGGFYEMYTRFELTVSAVLLLFCFDCYLVFDGHFGVDAVP
jgi:hypothetical protein